MGARNRIVGGRRFQQGGPIGRGKAAFVALVAGPAGTDGVDGTDGTDGTDGADWTEVVVAEEASFNPASYPTGTIAFLVDDLENPTDVSFGGKKGDGPGGDFPDPVPLT